MNARLGSAGAAAQALVDVVQDANEITGRNATVASKYSCYALLHTHTSPGRRSEKVVLQT